VLDFVLQGREQGIFVGLGLGGAEIGYPPKLFTDVYAEARQQGVHVVAHAGETGGPESVWGAINDLQVERIGHGVQSVEDEKLVDYLRQTQIPLEVLNVRLNFANKTKFGIPTVMVDISNLDIQIERVDDIPVVYGYLQKMKVQIIIDQMVIPHGNWQGLTPGWVIVIWLVHILTQHNHRMDCVQEWVTKHLTTLQRLTGQSITPLDFTDDRLALCLRALSPNETWHAIENQLGHHIIRVYELNKEKPHPQIPDISQIVRFDATTGIVNHNPENSDLFKIGKAKNNLFATLFKIMLASLDPLGIPIVVDVVSGNRADDPLYIPSYQRVKETIPGHGMLAVGDSKMSALATRACIAHNQDYYLTPLAHEKDEPGLLDELLKGKQEQIEEMELIFFPGDMPTNGDEPDPELAVACGFEIERERTAIVDGQEVVWKERLLIVQSFNYVQSMKTGLHQRLDKAEKALRALTPARQRGKRQIKDEESLLAAIEHIEKKHRVQGLFAYDYHQEVSERRVRGYRGKPARVERKVRFQLTVSRKEDAIAQAEFKAGWRIYTTNAPAERLSLAQTVWAYRDQYMAENVFRRLKGKILSITPLYIQRDDHAKGLFHLLTIASRVLALGDYLAKSALAQNKEELTNVYAGNPKRGTATPTMERMLQAFDNINLLILSVAERTQCQVTPLSPVQERILALLGLPTTLYTDLVTA
jgi:transposase